VIEECATLLETRYPLLKYHAEELRALKSQPAQPDPKNEALRLEVEKLRFGLENCRLLAARHRKEDWALLVLRFCAEAEVVGSVTR
jgi:regulator of replication initiation timing